MQCLYLVLNLAVHSVTTEMWKGSVASGAEFDGDSFLLQSQIR